MVDQCYQAFYVCFQRFYVLADTRICLIKVAVADHCLVTGFSGKRSLVREGTFFLGGGGLGNFGIFFLKKCWPSLAF